MLYRIIISWFSSWRKLSHMKKWMKDLQSRVDSTLKAKQKSDRELEESRLALLRIQTQFDKIVKDSRQAIARAEGLNKQLEEQLSASREALTTATELTVPCLVASHQLLMARWEEEQQIHSIRTAARKEVD